MRKLLVLAVLLFVGCASVGLPSPANTEQSIAYIYPAIATVRDLTATATTTRQINKAEATQVLKMTDAARSSADLAKEFVRNKDETKALANLRLAQGALREARKFVGLPEDPKLQ